MLKTILFIAAATITAAAATDPVTVRDVMLQITDPESTAVFDVVDAPRSEAEWSAARAHAARLVDSGELMLAPSRVKDNGEWISQVRAYADASAQLVKAADAKNFDDWLKASDSVAGTCVGCHKIYLGSQ